MKTKNHQVKRARAERPRNSENAGDRPIDSGFVWRRRAAHLLKTSAAACALLLVPHGAFAQTNPDLAIDDFSPKTGETGDIITIVGSGFDPDPDNNCAVVMMTATCSLPLQVLEVNPEGTEMKVEVGPVFQGAQAGPIMVALGQGEFGTFDPVVPEVEVVEPVWVWNRIPHGPAADTAAAGAAGVFTPVPPPEERWIHGEPNATGTICLIIDGNWCPEQELSMVVRLHDHLQGIGHDAFFSRMRLRGAGGSAQDCAFAICDMIVCAFFQQSGILINCTVSLLPSNEAKITISLPGGFIDWGNVDICLFPDETPPEIECSDIEVCNDPGLCSAVVDYNITVSDNCSDASAITVACNPPSGSVFPVGVTPVTCTATDEAGNVASCTFDVTVLDCEPPVVACDETVNPHGRNVPGGRSKGRGKGRNPDGFYELLAVSDNCDDPDEIDLFVIDSGSGTVFGPFSSADKIKYTEAPGATPASKKMGSGRGKAGAIAAHITGNGDAQLIGVDTSGNVSDPVDCLVPPPPK